MHARGAGSGRREHAFIYPGLPRWIPLGIPRGVPRGSPGGSPGVFPGVDISGLAACTMDLLWILDLFLYPETSFRVFGVLRGCFRSLGVFVSLSAYLIT